MPLFIINFFTFVWNLETKRVIVLEFWQNSDKVNECDKSRI